jgi:hypothetical protein
MSIAPAAPAALVLQQGASLAARLVPGQLVKAQVLHHFEGGRYLVRILGHDSVADSAAPLRPGETLQARVARLGERVELERVAAEAPGPEQSPASDGAAPGTDLVDELFRRYRASLEPTEAATLRRKLARAARPERMALAGLVLRKLELPIDAELLDATCAAMPLRGAARDVSAATAQTLAAVLVPDEGAPPGLRVLNVQGGGSVSHQAGAVALHLGGGEVAAEIAVFEESADEPRAGGEAPLRHRKLVLALDAPNLGRVEVRALSADGNLRVALASAARESTNALLRHGEDLVHALAGDGWRVDEIAYETREQAGPGAALGALLEHLVTPGSVSRFA